MATNFAAEIEREKYLFLESLRGLAALGVVLFHGGLPLAYESPIVANGFARNGYMFVDFFFVLSGFVIAYSYADRLKTRQQVAAFQIRRAFRLFPLHLLTLFVFLGYELLLLAINAPLQVQPFEANDGGAFLSHMFLLQGFTDASRTFNMPSWSISVEFYTYMLFAILMFASTNISRIFLDITAVAIVISCGIYLSGFETVDFARETAFFRCIFAFFMGVLIHRVSKSVRIHSAAAPFFLCITLIILTFRDSAIVPDLTFPPLFAIIVLCLVASGPSALKRALNYPPLVRLGTYSYGVYLWHWPVFWILPLAVGVLKGIEPYIDPVLHDTFLPLSVVGQSVLLVLGIGLTLSLAKLSYRFVEKPCNEWGRRITAGDVRVPQAVSAPVRPAE